MEKPWRLGWALLLVVKLHQVRLLFLLQMKQTNVEEGALAWSSAFSGAGGHPGIDAQIQLDASRTTVAGPAVVSSSRSIYTVDSNRHTELTGGFV